MKCLALFFHYRCHVLLWAFPFHYSNFFISFFLMPLLLQTEQRVYRALGRCKKVVFSFFHTLFFGISSSQLRFFVNDMACLAKGKWRMIILKRIFRFSFFFVYNALIKLFILHHPQSKYSLHDDPHTFQMDE